MQAQGLTIQTATSNDLPRLFEISSIVHSTNYIELIPAHRKKDFFDYYELVDKNLTRYVSYTRRKIDDPKYILLKATLGNELITGYISAEKFNDTTFEIRSLFIDPSYQRRGIGTKLMGEIIERYGQNDMRLKVIKGNRAAITLYEKYGFILSKMGIKKSFFGAQLLLMSRDAH